VYVIDLFICIDTCDCCIYLYRYLFIVYLIAVFILYRYSEDPDSTDESKVVNVSNDYSSDTLDSKVLYVLKFYIGAS
jgi:hypothetical protein